MADATKRPRESLLDQGRCLAYVGKLWEADTLAMFHHPVSADVARYHAAIKSPIDLSTIRAGIEAGRYATDADVQDDVALMISNAIEFNDSGSEWQDLARRFRKEYLVIAQGCGLTVDADAAFIPAKRARDDESTLRKAEAKYGERFDDVLGDLEKEKDIPLEELRKMYSRKGAAFSDEDNGDDKDEEDDSSSGSGSDDEEDEESEGSSDDGSDEEEDEDDESDSS